MTHSQPRQGRALKTAYEYFLANLPQHIGLITADADGSNALEDIWRWRAFTKNPDRYAVVGQRDIYNKVPLRSRLGNKMNAALSACSTADTSKTCSAGCALLAPTSLPIC